ncbi:MAG: prepilin-type N-terminal cleavage/methylation domain-containing protein [Deltaproteobacteria bacterium]|nr:prepilin-type N-terminal cleavage/methylation domain-containing protein [Deltaproteobacteria bacterium]
MNQSDFTPRGAPLNLNPQNQAGFTLLEVLVALTLASTALAALLYLVRLQTDSELTVQERLEVVTQGAELLNQWLMAPRIMPGVYEGATRQGRKWTVTVTKAGPSAEEELPALSGPGSGTSNDNGAFTQGVLSPGSSLDEENPDSPSALGRNTPARAASQAAILLGVEVCCRWKTYKEKRVLCMSSNRTSPPLPVLR